MSKMTVRLGVAALASVVVLATAVQAAPQKPRETEPLADTSAVLGTPFPQKPFVLKDDGTYQTLMGAIAKESHKKCVAVENYGWDLKNGDKAQATLQSIVDATMDTVQNSGYKAVQLSPAVTKGRNVVSIAVEKGKKYAVLSWIPVGDGVVLLICDTAAAK